jgi:hypothetical protein
MGACFTEAEVRATIKVLPPDKSPGSDGYTARFFASIVGADQVRHHGGVGRLLVPGHARSSCHQ